MLTDSHFHADALHSTHTIGLADVHVFWAALAEVKNKHVLHAVAVGKVVNLFEAESYNV